MRIQATLAAAALFAAGAVAQDKITLTNGDVLTGTIKSMADGKVVIASPALGDVTVPLDKVGDLTTAAQVKLETKTGDLLQRRLLGIEAGNLKMEGATTSLPLADLGQINPPDKKEPEWIGALKVSVVYGSSSVALTTALYATSSVAVVVGVEVNNGASFTLLPTIVNARST